METSEEIKLDPPALIKGSASPAKGMRPTITAMLIAAWIPMEMASPEAINVPSMSGARPAMTKPRQIRRPYKMIKTSAPASPSSSTITAKMLSVGGTGKPVSFDSPLPMPTPNQPPLTMASKERCTWYDAWVGSLNPAMKAATRS